MAARGKVSEKPTNKSFKQSKEEITIVTTNSRKIHRIETLEIIEEYNYNERFKQEPKKAFSLMFVEFIAIIVRLVLKKLLNIPNIH